MKSAGLSRYWIAPGIAVVLPAVGYGSAFLYEAAFFDAFRIPEDLIQIEITRVLVATATLIMILSAMALASYFCVVPLSKRSGNPIYASLTRLVAYSVAVLPLILLFRHIWQKWVVVWLALVAVWLVVEFIPTLVKRAKRSRSFRSIISKQEEAQPQQKVQGPTTPSPDSSGGISVGRIIFYIALAIMMIVWISDTAGQASAMRKDEFLVLSGPRESVVLRIYEDKMICAPLNREKREIETDFFVLKPGDDPTITLKLEEVGPLAPAQP